MKYEVTYKHKEGDGINTVKTGKASGIYTTVIDADDEKDALETFDACFRHGDFFISMRPVTKVDIQTAARLAYGKAVEEAGAVLRAANEAAAAAYNAACDEAARKLRKAIDESEME